MSCDDESEVLIIEFKRGDTLTLDIVAKLPNNLGVLEPLDITLVNIASKIKDSSGAVIATPFITKITPLDGLYNYEVSNVLTGAFETGDYKSDIEYTISGQVISTKTFILRCLEDIT